MAELRGVAETIIPQMTHCTRCRADAVGLLRNDRSSEFRGCLSECASTFPIQTDGRPYVAVGTMEGMLVNLHLGEADRFQIWGPSQKGYAVLDVRQAPQPGSGIDRWYALAKLLADCRAVLVSGVGETPKQVLSEHQILVVEMNGFIEAGLTAVYSGGDTAVLKGRRAGAGCSKSAGCSGTGGGCG